MELYLNGLLLGVSPATASFHSVSGKQNFIGAWHAAGGERVDTFDGRIAEFRVWRTRRNAEEIRGTMFQRLNGSEAGLVGLWNFANVEAGLVKDATPAGHHGRLIGNARVVTAELPAAPEAEGMEYVLELDGANSFVELPAASFTNLAGATIEGWVKWESFGNCARFFDFWLGDRWLDVQNRFTRPDLWVEQTIGDSVAHTDVPGVLASGRWIHIAVTSTHTRLELFLDGLLVATNLTTGTFDTSSVEKRNFLGRSNWTTSDNPEFHGQMDEVRVWNHVRTPAQIEASMFQRLTGTEPGLVGLWNFNDPANPGRDASTNGHHGTFEGNARAVQILSSDVQPVESADGSLGPTRRCVRRPSDQCHHPRCCGRIRKSPAARPRTTAVTR